MPFEFFNVALLAQDPKPLNNIAMMIVAAQFAVALLLPALLATPISKVFRAKDYWWRLYFIFASITCSAVLIQSGWPPKLGVQLAGGVILIYEIEKDLDVKGGSNESESREDKPINMDDLIAALKLRINNTGLEEVILRKYGSDQVEIIIPAVDKVEIDRIKEKIVTTGTLQFQIVANSSDHELIIEAATLAAENPLTRRNKRVLDPDPSTPKEDQLIGLWARVGREDEKNVTLQKFKIDVLGSGDTIRDANTGKLIKPRGQIAAGASTDNVIIHPGGFNDTDNSFEKWLDDSGIKEIDVLMAIDDNPTVTGSHLQVARTSTDEYGAPAISFEMTSEGSRLMGQLTGNNLPNKIANHYRRLGIVFDGNLISAARIMSQISSRGEITGRFTEDEVKFVVSILRAGRLPAALNPNPLSENQTDPMLGRDTIEKGAMAIGFSMLCVLVFIMIYYRFAGLVACVALITNMVLIMGFMILANASFTLPGIAGLVLTVGMSVDANVLIFERIREELAHGAALRMAIRNGFNRATTTIVDANITTLITAFVLYVIGTDQIQGFAVTLILGILTSMFTAIFCSRIFFEMTERSGYLKKLTMMHILGTTQFNFMSKRKIAAAVSIVLIVIGLVSVVARGKSIFGIDLAGGTSVHMLFQQPIDPSDMRAKLQSSFAGETVNGGKIQYTLTSMQVANQPADTVYKIDSTVPEVEDLQKLLQQGFKTPDGGPLYETYSMDFEPIKSINLPSTSKRKEASPPQDSEAASEENENAQENADLSYSETQLTFKNGINAPTLKSLFEQSSQTVDVDLAKLILKPVNPEDGWNEDSNQDYKAWIATASSSLEDSKKILDQIKADLNNTAVWPSSNKIGGKVAGDAQSQAIAAMLTSLFGIVAYIWLRFQRVIFGLAAVVALLHDVLITLGAIAVSFWLTGALGFLLIDEFKISLPIVAAFLTIIGYSLNDTIVVFDRIREVRGRSPDLTEKMINTSLNQTMSRTILTSATTLIVVSILYVFGGDGIHGFAFSLVVGVVAGTYSSIFIASPVLLWMTSLDEGNGNKVRKTKSATA